jgi:hypothetical protein
VAARYARHARDGRAAHPCRFAFEGVGRLGVGCGERAADLMKHAVLAIAALLYWVVVGTTHSWVPATLMLAAIHHDYVFTRARDAPRQS